MDEIKTKLINDPSLVITSLSSRLKMMETSTEACSETWNSDLMTFVITGLNKYGPLDFIMMSISDLVSLEEKKKISMDFFWLNRGLVKVIYKFM